MSITVLGAALHGVDAIPIEVEVDLLRRLPRITIVGLPTNAVRESAERLRSALTASGVDFPKRRVIINLAPADVRKDGTALDLPMALALLAADGQLPEDRVQQLVAVGELSLSGALRPIRGALSMALMARAQGKTLVVPTACAAQAALVPGVTVLGADSLAQVCAFLKGEDTLHTPVVPAPRAHDHEVDLAHVRGQHLARRALEISAAGAHHLLMVGPPGCGKSMLAQRLPTILPPMDFEEALDTTRVHSAAGLLGQGAQLIHRRPFRAPHHSVTVAGLVGDRTLRPGELSLAHNGVLFLDEAPEFPRSVLEVLRQPLEDGVLQLSRAIGTVTYPAGITLVLALNPCPCGQRGGVHPCRCTDNDVHRYLRRLSGPILDRIDLHVQLQPVPPEQLLGGAPGEPSATVRDRVTAARRAQKRRGQEQPNGRLSAEAIRRLPPLSARALAALHGGVRSFGLSGRAANRLIKVARTIADLDQAEQVDEAHLMEALSFRPVDVAHA